MEQAAEQRKKALVAEAEQALAALSTEAVGAMFAPTQKKQSPRRRRKRSALQAEEGVRSGLVDDGLIDPVYEDLLRRAREQMRAGNPTLAKKEKKVISPPEVMRMGTTRSCWMNFQKIMQQIQRDEQHAMDYFTAELGTTGSIDGKHQLVMKGKFPPGKIESLLRKYIQGYVMCQYCKSLETQLEKDQKTRLFFLQCLSCGARRSAEQISKGAQAVRRGERKKARQAQG